MSLPHAILTALLEKPGSGAELARRFDKSFGFFWPATHQQIYRELGKLEKDGLVRSGGRDSSRGRAKDYTVLAAGRKELSRWTLEQQEPRPVREELMIRLRASSVLGDVPIEEELQRHLALHRTQLATYLQLDERGPWGEANRLQRAVLQAGIMFEQAWIEWAEHTLALQAGAATERESSAS
ncbi:PadR family transcriptional regulator [Arthrobacter sp. CAU 1506]|uniref:PadR family transcriptional regulator n=1 Tax=Arthrobacter sp. CAU 1506 TaxID=2560052 RepID=UPI0010AD4F06|nr:PadR family transcriptional regulator [Arthrobacter sp. CAU 1506]TJY64633.1 PadR family transcriptional regulator [Arthrobacter sp. CAU 1506]